MTGTGSGEVLFDLGHLLPSQEKIAFRSEMTVGMNISSQKQTMTMTMETNLQLETK